MGKVKRFTCILTPMLLTTASLLCFVFVMLGQMPTGSTNLPKASPERDLYFFKADTSNMTPNLVGNQSVSALQAETDSKRIKDFYQVGLFLYCEGEKDTATGKETVTYCSDLKLQFYFDFTDLWQPKNRSIQYVMAEDFKKGIQAYKKAVGWMNQVFVITLALTAAEFMVGFFAIFSRWGSLVTTIVSTAQTVFALVAATAATCIYLALTGIFESILQPNNIEASMDVRTFSILWLAAFFSIASAFFWLISVCCCSGR